MLFLGETFNLLPKLRKHRAGRYRVSVRAALFETRVKYGRTSYITGLYNERVDESILVKACDEPYDHIIVWLDRIGITAVEFLPQGVSLATRSGSPWMYAVIALDDHVEIKSKPGPLPNIRVRKGYDDVLVRYVPLRDTCGISVAFGAGAVLAVVSHTQRDQNNPVYAEMGEYAIWMHCPLAADEVILAVWSLLPKGTDLKTYGLVIKTQRKMVWLSPLITADLYQLLEATQIANDSIQAFYYSDPSKAYNHVVGTIPTTHASSGQQEIPTLPNSPSYQTAAPGDLGMCVQDWHYSDAPLTGVNRVRLCMEGEYCIGLLLQYDKYDRTVGQFRYDKDIFDYLFKPAYVALKQVL
ncbi:hypothetical protein GMOD_00009568 [Pyrenophora seminiperda CCB06]|uniref:Uncharacterized protein n=1 Tax=Pyrenophora seminiperda CCB06 TaxID=1302712 RepID=A0A3M7MF09_9PLEO|nr:hypothetical protein GMOD_00009568 [Pyrenophora seminiperda CCB06]